MKKTVAVLLAFALFLCAGCAQKSDVEAQIEENAPPVYSKSSEKEEESSDHAPRDVVLSFLGCGDNMIYYGNVREAKYLAQGTDKTYDFSPTYEHVAPLISQADIAFINQETLMCGGGYDLSYYPRFNSPQEVGDTLQSVGFDVVNIANNHMLDKDEDGLAATIKYWNSKPDVLLIGGYTDESDSKTIRYLEKEGVTIAFLAYTTGTNGLTCADGAGAYVPYLSTSHISEVTEDIQRARQMADVVIVSAHWGVENSFYPNEEQKTLAQAMADAGADVILGHHPHVLQPIVWLTASDGRQTLCAYSLGNFVSEMSEDYQIVGGMLTFDIHVTDAGASIEQPQFIPTVYHFNSSFYDNAVWLMKDYTSEMASIHGIRYYGNVATLENLRGYVQRTIDASFLPPKW